jgi:hypothetical protein
MRRSAATIKPKLAHLDNSLTGSDKKAVPVGGRRSAADAGFRAIDVAQFRDLLAVKIRGR